MFSEEFFKGISEGIPDETFRRILEEIHERISKAFPGEIPREISKDYLEKFLRDPRSNF